MSYHKKVYSYVRARINDEHEAEDITSGVFVKVMSSFDSYDSEKAALSTWIYTIASNAIRDHLRKVSVRSKYRADVDEDHLEVLVYSEDSCLDSLLNEETLELLADALEALSERERMIIVMHYYKELPHKEIAEHLGLSYANVRFISHRAIEKIRSYFSRHQYI